MHSPIEMYFAGNEFFFLNSRSFEVAFRSRGLELKLELKFSLWEWSKDSEREFWNLCIIGSRIMRIASRIMLKLYFIANRDGIFLF